MLVTMKPIMEAAVKGHYGVPAPNIFGIEMAQAAIAAAEEMNSPLILNAGSTAYNYRDLQFYIPIVRELCIKSRVPLAINFDHGKTFEHAVTAVQSGYSSMMADRSTLPFEENAAQSAEICRMAHAAGMSMEAELGHVSFGNLSGEQEDGKDDSMVKTQEDVARTFTKVEEAVRFVELTKVDCLAVAVGTVHGNYPKGLKPTLQFDLIEELADAVKIPLVLHGCSGTGDENLRRAAGLGVAKFNIGTENLIKAYAARDGHEINSEKNLLKRFWTEMQVFNDAYKQNVKHYIEVLGCAGKA